jgi:polar amino acid transport system substrate-binding protein
VNRRPARGIAAVAIAALAMAACSATDNGGVVGGQAQARQPVGPPGALHGRLPATVATRGVLRVGAAVGRAPLLFYGTGTTVPEGIEWDLLQAIGRQLGVSITVTNVPLAGLGPDLAAGRIDAFMSGFVDLKRFEAQGIDFVDYLTGRTGALVRQGNPSRITGAGDLCGRSVVVQLGTASQLAAAQTDADCRRRGRPALSTRVAADHAGLLRMLTSGQVQAALDDAVVAAYTAQGSTGPDTVEAVGPGIDPVPYGMGVARSDQALSSALQAALRAVIADGEYDQDLARWGGEGSALRTAPIDAGA